MRTYLPLVVLLAIPMAIAGTAEAPELTDAADDVDLQGAPAAWAAAADLRSVWFWDDAEGLHAAIQVEDLSTISTTDVGALQDTMWLVLWQTHYAEPGEVASRTGEWMLRAEYRPLDDPAWHFWMERPCRDGNDDDGCAGGDRDIIDGLDGTVDMDASTISLTAPWRFLGTPAPGDAIWGPRAFAEMVWPSYPAYAIDEDSDEWGQCYRFTAVPADPDNAGSVNDGATGTSHGATLTRRPTADPCVDPEPVNATAEEEGPTMAENNTSVPPPGETASGSPSETAPTEKRSPAPWTGVLLALAFLARRR